MKAIVYHHYGAPDVIQCEEIEKPTVGDTQVLIKVCAAAVNPLDWHYLRGKPYIMRLQFGLRTPKDTRLGVDVAGVVEAVAKNVTEFKPGDAVFGSCSGAFAEYACAGEKALVKKPENVTFEQAAAVPVAAFTALQGLRDYGQLQPGQQVLINGAAGGVGTFAVQIAKALGATVTGVCSTRNVELVRSLGAAQVLDYTKIDFTQSGQRFDLFLDCIGNHSLTACRRVLQPKGNYVIVGGPDGRWLGPLTRGVKAILLDRFVNQKLVMFIAKTNKADLAFMRDLLADGKVKPVIDRCYPLQETPAAIRYLEAGHARGKVIVTGRE
ncbi:MAG: NAD(P)-dependent alcohol dehydrogenase [Caldilineaceae bacterium]